MATRHSSPGRIPHVVATRWLLHCRTIAAAIVSSTLSAVALPPRDGCRLRSQVEIYVEIGQLESAQRTSLPDAIDARVKHGGFRG
jgi:hypothetical protein